jgi:hypothetical protein
MMMGLSVIGWLIYRYCFLPPPFTDDEIGILIAEVPDQKNHEQQSAYQNTIRGRVQSDEQLREIVKVRLIERPLPPDADAQQAEALRIGRWLRASFVLRPFAVEGTQEPWLTVVNPQDIFQPEASLGQFSSKQLATLDTLPLPDNLAQLAETAVAATLALRGFEHQHQIGGAKKARLVTLLSGEIAERDGEIAERDGEMGLAHAGRSEEHHVLGAFDEGQAGQLHDLLARRADGEVEVVLVERFNRRKAGNPRKQLAGARPPRFAFGQQQLLNEVGE